MEVKPPFFLREQYNTNIVRLLKSVTLGSNGALYHHNKIDKRIDQLYRPLYLNLERNDKVLGNITFCRRPKSWYVRYFAFDIDVQTSTNKVRSKASTHSGLKRIVNQFFEDSFRLDKDRPDMFYAYIDPRNERSLWMSQNFDFQTISKIATQTFSRVKLKPRTNVQPSSPTDFIRKKVEKIYGNHPFYFTHHTFNEEPFYTLTHNNQIVAFAKTHEAEWKIVRLPGKNGALIKKIIPYVPGLRKIISPNSHSFITVDTVWSEGNNPKYIQQLFEGILHHKQTHTIIWWVDQKEEVYQKVKKSVNWGLLNKINGVHEVDLVVRHAEGKIEKLTAPTYVTGIDFI